MANSKIPYNLRSMTMKRRKEENWDAMQCPICQEVPHNAVLLLCSNHGIGCRPYMCDTGDSLSDCFSWFCAKHVVKPISTDRQSPNLFLQLRVEESFACPLCRGDLEGWVLVQSARDFMDGMVRPCPLEPCQFSGNYAHLKKHAATVAHDPRPKPTKIILPGDEEYDDYQEYDENFQYPSYFDYLSPSDFEGTVEPSRPDDDMRDGSHDETQTQENYE